MQQTQFDDQLSCATSDDYASMSKVIIACLQKVNSRDYPADVIDGLVQRHTPENLEVNLSEKYALVLKRRGEVVATGALNGSEIVTVFVKPELHGRGIGRKIMQALEKRALELGYESVEIHSSITAVEFYEKQGYQHLDKVNRHVGGESFHMHKYLN